MFPCAVFAGLILVLHEAIAEQFINEKILTFFLSFADTVSRRIFVVGVGDGGTSTDCAAARKTA